MKGKGKVLPLLAILLLTALFAAAGLAEQAEQATLTALEEPAEAALTEPVEQAESAEQAEPAEQAALTGLAEPAEEDGLAEWTVMFYLCGSDLETKHGYATGNLEEILQCSTAAAINKLMSGATAFGTPMQEEVSAPPVQVLIQTGGSREWHAGEIGMDVAADRLERWRFQPADSVFDADSFVKEAELPLASMANRETLADFIRWGAERCPARKYALVLWGHGGGAKTGILVDELFGGDILYLDELGGALADSGVLLETVVFDACLMANLETACAVRHSARWMVASEEVVAGRGTAVGKWLQQLYLTPQWSGDRLGRWICEMTQKKFSDEENEQAQETLTWSVIDLLQVDRVAEFFDRLFEQIGRIYMEEPAKMMWISSYIDELFEYGLGADDDTVDLAELFYSQYISGVVEPEIYNGMLEALMDTVVFSVHTTDRSKALGLSFCDAMGSTAAELEIYARNCPSAHYLAFLDAITPEWTAPDRVYRQAKPLPDIREIGDYRMTVRKTFDADGTPGIIIEDGFANLRYVHCDLLRENGETGNTVRLGSTIVVPVFDEDVSGLFTLRRFWMWPAVEGVHCDAELSARYMMVDSYNIPVRLGTEKYLLRCGMNLVTQELTIFGLWEGYESDSRAFGRNTMHLSQMAGREYSLLYSIDGTKQYEASEPMTMYRALEIKAEKLPAGDYILNYWVESTFSRRLEVGRAALHWDGEKVSVPPEASWEGVMDLNL